MSEEGHARLDSLASQVNEKVANKKDPNRRYVGLEHLPRVGSSLAGTAALGQSVSVNSVFRTGDVLFGKLRPRLRKSVRASFDGYCSTDILVLRPSSEVDPNYAGFVLQSDPVFAEAIRTEEGTKMPRCSWSTLRRLSVYCPERHLQERIAQILATVDEAIDRTSALISKMEQVREGVRYDLLTRGVAANGALRPTHLESPGLYRETALGWIPNEWTVRRLDKTATVNRGKFTIRPRNDPRFYDGRYPFIQTGDVATARGRVLSTYSQTLNERGLSVSRLFPVGTVMVTIAANIADTCILGLPMCAPDSIVGVVPDVVEDARYLELCIRQRQRWLESRAPQTAQKNINLDDLRPLLIPYPVSDERTRITASYEAAESKVQSEHATLIKLFAIKQGLMRDLLTGHVQVIAKSLTRVANV